MKKIFLILYLLIGITSVKAGCYKYARAGGISNRTNGHQTDCRSFGTFNVEGTVDKSCFTTLSSSNESVVRLGFSGSKPCFYSVGHGIATATISIKASCMCSGVAYSETFTVNLSEWGLRNIGVEGIKTIRIDDKVKTYTITVPANVSSVNVIATPNDKRSKVVGTGVKNLVTGNNTFKVSVTSITNRTETYTLIVVREKAVDVTKIIVDDKLQMNIDESYALKVKYEPSDAIANLKYETSNSSVATVSSDGTITAIKPGTATITVSSNGVKATVEVTVRQNVSGIKFKKDMIKLFYGESAKLEYEIYPYNATDKKVKFSSSDPSVVKVLEDGTIIATGVGKANIFVVTEDSDYSSLCVVKVTQKIEKIYLSTLNFSLKIGESKKISVTLEPDRELGEEVIWESSNNNIAYVDNGLVLARGAGTAQITAKSTSGGAISTVIVTVEGEKKPTNNLLYIIISIIILAMLGGLLILNKKNQNKID